MFWNTMPCKLGGTMNLKVAMAASSFYREDGHRRFLQNISTYLSNYTAAHPKRLSATSSVIGSSKLIFCYKLYAW
jgi:hypothetical protein